MSHPLLDRLDAIGRSLAACDDALALIGLGSVGLDTHRLDAWSDLDFFAIVAADRKASYLDDLGWLARAHPLAWQFRNTADGYKVLMADGVLCEFAVFEPQELAAVPFAPGRVVWKRDGIDEGIAVPRQRPPSAVVPDESWLIGEALSNLLVGLGRWHRGERLSAARFVQGHALDRLIELDALRTRAPADDPFNRDRRLEARQPALAAMLPALVPGYEGTPQAALALLEALRARGAALDAMLESMIRRLAQAAPHARSRQ